MASRPLVTHSSAESDECNATHIKLKTRLSEFNPAHTHYRHTHSTMRTALYFSYILYRIYTLVPSTRIQISLLPPSPSSTQSLPSEHSRSRSTEPQNSTSNCRRDCTVLHRTSD